MCILLLQHTHKTSVGSFSMYKNAYYMSLRVLHNLLHETPKKYSSLQNDWTTDEFFSLSFCFVYACMVIFFLFLVIIHHTTTTTRTSTTTTSNQILCVHFSFDVRALFCIGECSVNALFSFLIRMILIYFCYVCVSLSCCV